MDIVLEELVRIYGVKDYDWMRFKITRENPLTYHHIVKEQHGGKRLISNGAPLTEFAHQYLNQIEKDDQIIFSQLNRRLERINESGRAPTKEDLKVIAHLLKKYEQLHEYELRRRIKSRTYNPKILREVSPQRDLFSPTNIRIVMQKGIDPSGYPVKRMKKGKNKKSNYQKKYVKR